MKNVLRITAFLLLVLFALPTFVFAQDLSKEEEKVWKNRAKEYKKNPAALMKLVEQKEEAEQLAAQASQRLKLVQQSEETLQSQVANLQAQLADTRNKLAAAKSQPKPPANQDDMSGMLYRVQIAAFKNEGNQVPDFLNSSKGLQIEYDNGFQKLILGNFRALSDAEELVRHLVRIGFSDAFVAAYDNGKRIPLDQDNIPGND